MRLNSFIAIFATVVAMNLAVPQSASASGWARERTVHHWVYYPRYHHVYVSHRAIDPYGYSYTPRGYYPYYNSHYWGAPRIKRFRGVLPPYYAAWGAPRRHYRHVKLHRRHYGAHRRGDW